MSALLRSLSILALGFALLVAQSTVAALAPFHALAPNLLLPIIIYLGVSPDVHIARGAALAFVLGYLQDLFCGNPMSLQTFLLVATFFLARGAGLRLFLRGPIFQVVLTFLVGLLVGGAAHALRAIFEPPAPFPAEGVWRFAGALLWPALVTALAAPIVFVALRRVDVVSIRRRDEAGVAT